MPPLILKSSIMKTTKIIANVVFAYLILVMAIVMANKLQVSLLAFLFFLLIVYSLLYYFNKGLK